MLAQEDWTNVWGQDRFFAQEGSETVGDDTQKSDEITILECF